MDVLYGWIAILSFPWVLGIMLIGVIGFYSAVAARATWTAITLVVIMGVFISLSNYSLWDWALNNWIMLLIYTVIYLAIGVAWTFIKWTLNLLKVRRTYAVLRDDQLPKFLHARGLTELTPNLFEDFQSHLYKVDGKATRKAVEMNISSSFVADQMFLWPAYMFGFLVADALTALAEFISSAFGGTFRRIRNFIFRGMPEVGV